MNSSEPRQRAAIAGTALLLTAATSTVLVLLPVHLVADLDLAPAAYGALVGAGASVYAGSLCLGRYLTHRTPGRLLILCPGTAVAVLSSTLVVQCRSGAGIALSAVLGLAALGAVREAWSTLVEVSAAGTAARWAGRTGAVVGQLAAVLAVADGVTPAHGVEAGSALGLVALVLLASAVEDRRAPSTPRTSASLARARLALGSPAVRRLIGLGFLAGAVPTAGAIAVVAALGSALGPGAAPGLLAGTVVLAATCGAAVRTGVELSAAARVAEDLRRATRAILGHVFLVGVGCAALGAGLGTEFWAQRLR